MTTRGGKPSDDSFGTFLKKMKRTAAPSRSTRAGSARDASVSPLELLHHLRSDRSTPVQELMAETQLDLFDLAAALKAVATAGLVEIEKGDGPERVRLTPTGARLIAGS